MEQQEFLGRPTQADVPRGIDRIGSARRNTKILQDVLGRPLPNYLLQQLENSWRSRVRCIFRVTDMFRLLRRQASRVELQVTKMGGFVANLRVP